MTCAATSTITLAITATTTRATTPNRRPPTARQPQVPLFGVLAIVGWSLLAVGGVYSWAVTPAIIACVAVALIQRPRLLAPGPLDPALWLVLTAVGLQLVPLPFSVIERLTPRAVAVGAAVFLGRSPAPDTLHPISIDPRATAQGLAIAGSAVLLFWTCRDLFAQGGIRRFVRAVAWLGVAASIVAIAQRATAPRTIYWFFKPEQPAGRPFGPFVNRNHLATWLLMSTPLTAGYLMTRLRARAGASRVDKGVSLVAAIDWDGIRLASYACVMAIGLFMSFSRSGLLGFAAALVTLGWFGRDRTDARERSWLLVWSVCLALVLASYVRFDVIMTRVDQSLSGGLGQRTDIWAVTMQIARDFWLTGTGLGTFASAMLVYQPSLSGLFFNQAHSHYLQLAAEGGALLGVPAVLALISFVTEAVRRLRHDRSPIYWMRLGALAGLIGVLAQSIWETGLRMPANAYLAAALAAIVVHESKSGIQDSGGRIQEARGRITRYPESYILNPTLD